MLDICYNKLPNWPEHLKPIGEGTFDKEVFEIWWGRHKESFQHLDSRILEQWVHRHWHCSPYSFVPLATLKSTLISMSPSEIIKATFNRCDEYKNPDYDYSAFHGAHFENGKHPTALALDEGEWDFPIIMIHTPNGFLSRELKMQNEYLLIEGHQRVRYANALMHRGVDLIPQKVFLLESPIFN